MLVQKFYYRELVINASKILGVLVILLPIVELFQLLDGINKGAIPSFVLVNLVILSSLASFPMILQIACFFAVIITLNRYCKDSEFVVWLTSGLSAFYWLRTTIIFMLPMAIICGICSLYITPWATVHSQQYSHYVASQKLNKLISPGNFRQSLNAQQVFYVSKYEPQNNLIKNLFLQYISNDHNIYNVAAKQAQLITKGGVIKASVINGHIYQLNESLTNIFNVDFKQLTASVENNYIPLNINSLGVHAQPLGFLLNNLTNSSQARVELAWRISIIIMLLAMVAVVVPLSIQIGRMHSSIATFILAPLISAVYQNVVLVTSGQEAKLGVLPILEFLMVHSALFILAILLTYIKTFPKGYFRLPW